MSAYVLTLFIHFVAIQPDPEHLTLRQCHRYGEAYIKRGAALSFKCRKVPPLNW